MTSLRREVRSLPVPLTPATLLAVCLLPAAACLAELPLLPRVSSWRALPPVEVDGSLPSPGRLPSHADDTIGAKNTGAKNSGRDQTGSAAESWSAALPSFPALPRSDEATTPGSRNSTQRSEPPAVATTETSPAPLAHRPHSRTAPLWPRTAEGAVVNEAARQHVMRGFALGDRRALFAARKEFFQALRMIAQATDAAYALPSGDPASCLVALNRAQEAFAEVTELARCQGHAEQFAQLLTVHRTAAALPQRPTTVVAAQQAYLAFATAELKYAAAGNPLASQALAGLGKCALLDDSAGNTLLQQAHALAWQQAAVATDPRNHLAANELGVLLGKFGQWNEAKRVMLSAVAVHADAASWQNLATIHGRLGEQELAQLAWAESRACRAMAGPGAAASAVDGRPGVEWVDPRAFGGPPDDAPATPLTARRAPAPTSRR